MEIHTCYPATSSYSCPLSPTFAPFVEKLNCERQNSGFGTSARCLRQFCTTLFSDLLLQKHFNLFDG